MTDISRRLGEDKGRGRRVSKKVEKRLADLTGGRVVKGSGQGIGVHTRRMRRPGGWKSVAYVARKGDVQAYGDLALLESKETEGESIGVSREWCRKIVEEAIEQRRFPALVITFQSADPRGSEQRDWVAIPFPVFDDLVKHWIATGGKEMGS